MSNTAVKVASVFFVVLASTAGSFARGGGSAGAVGGVRPSFGAIGARRKVRSWIRAEWQRQEGGPATAAADKRPEGSAVQVMWQGTQP